MPKKLIGISILLMTLSLIFGFLNTNKVKTLRDEVATTASARDVANQARTKSEKNFKAREKEMSEAKTKAADAEAKAQTAENELGKAQSEKAEVEAKVQADEAQIADLQKQGALYKTIYPDANGNENTLIFELNLQNA